ncbi:hypothetical protein K458DRAFT_436843 [Lentithecium fluviatile CBS 122367]|uniref:Uncharacterized protein n=1 Tax=Lentithecium fluviatile CBS 122367 TaxID=1168545 RepID=A0A6G1IFY5_9PLEO|nr:hypothetical protein K458DRAFT_436843 [Lentithecium fluviatile CBS 122367]
MSKYTLYITLEGPGDLPHHRSHWSFAFLRPNSPFACIYQVLLLDGMHLIHHLDRRDGVPFPIVGSEGAVKLAELDDTKYVEAQKIIAEEAPSRNGHDRCQDWTLNCVIALEVAEVLEPGCAEFVGACVGLSAREVKERAGERWVDA